MLRFGLTTSEPAGADALVRPGGEGKRARTRMFAANDKPRFAVPVAALVILVSSPDFCPATRAAKAIIDTDIGDDIDEPLPWLWRCAAPSCRSLE